MAASIASEVEGMGLRIYENPNLLVDQVIFDTAKDNVFIHPLTFLYWLNPGPLIQLDVAEKFLLEQANQKFDRLVNTLRRQSLLDNADV